MPKAPETRVLDAARSGRGCRRRDLRRAARACGRRGDAPADAARVPEDAGGAAAPPPAARPAPETRASYAALWVRILRFCRGRCLAFLPGRWLGALTLCFFTVCEAVAPRRTR